MYSRGTERRRVKLPPGYDGSAFRHDTGEIRQPDTDMKIHVATPMTVDEKRIPLTPTLSSEQGQEDVMAETMGGTLVPEQLPEKRSDVVKKTEGSFLEGILTGLGSEEWLLFLVILLLLADGSDAWDIILLLCLLLAVHGD